LEVLKGLRRLEELPMAEIREQNPAYWKWLNDQVYEKHHDAEKHYQSAEGDYRSKKQARLSARPYNGNK
jgi:hypothetical protein